MDPTSRVTTSETWEKLYDIMECEASFEEKTRRVLSLGTQYLGADKAVLARIEPELDTWKAAVSTEPPDHKLHEGAELPLETIYCRRVIESDSQVNVHDAPNQGWEDDPAFEVHGYRSYLGTPVSLGDISYGTVCFIGDDSREQFSTDETLLAELIARLIERELQLRRHTDEIADKTNLAAALARVLRHNIRNSLTLIRGYTIEMRKQAGDDEYSEIVLREVDTLIELTEQARRLETILTQDDKPTLRDIVPIVNHTTDAVAKGYPEASVSVMAPEELVLPVRPSFERAVKELVENALKHGSGPSTVSITIEPVDKAAEIRVRDDGPGLPELEQTAIEAGETTPLTHGIGLGLWTVRWVVGRHGGTIESTNTDEGSMITITLPERPSAEEQASIDEITQSRDQYKASFDEANDALIIFDEAARIVDANPQAADIYGVKRQSLLGRSFNEFLPEDYSFETAWESFQETKNDDEATHDAVVEIVGGDGERHVVEYSVVSNIVPDQHLIVMRELTSQGRYSSTYEQIFNQTFQFTGLMRPDGTVIEANETALEFGGLDRSDVIGEKLWETRWFRDSEPARQDAREAVKRGANKEFVRQNLTISGAEEEAVIDFSIRPLTDDQGNVRLLIPEGRLLNDRRGDNHSIT